MIYSMTAFGRVQREQGGYGVKVEIRTVNSRYLDVVPRLPKNHLGVDAEQGIRKLIAQTMRRGRVEVYLSIESIPGEQKAAHVDPILARLYWEELQSLHRHLPGSDVPRLQHLLQCPNLFQCFEEVVDQEALNKLVLSAVGEALEQVQAMRAREGELLVGDCLERLRRLGEAAASVEDRRHVVVEEQRDKLRDRIRELLQGTDVEPDENRLLQEIAYMAERSDVTEEIVRIRSHLDQMETALQASEPAEGRRLDFLAQELLREVNTIGSKASDLPIARAVVDMKSEIGKLKEQIQNIE